MCFTVFFTTSHDEERRRIQAIGLQADSHPPRRVEALGVDQELVHMPRQGCPHVDVAEFIANSYRKYDGIIYLQGNSMEFMNWKMMHTSGNVQQACVFFS